MLAWAMRRNDPATAEALAHSMIRHGANCVERAEASTTYRAIRRNIATHRAIRRGTATYLTIRANQPVEPLQ